MKYRAGYISNSSSSSFIIVVKPTDICPHCGRKDSDKDELISLIEQSTWCDTEMSGEGMEAVKELVSYYYDDNYKEEIISKAEKAVGDGDLIVCNVSYHDDFILDKIKNSKNIVIVNKENE